MESERPWGRYEILLDSEYCKVKRIIVKPRQRLSYQSHEKRDETWTIITGEALVTIDDADFVLRRGQTIKIDRKQKHRVENIMDDSELVFIEVQVGDYFGEDDIKRYSDDYGR